MKDRDYYVKDLIPLNPDRQQFSKYCSIIDFKPRKSRIKSGQSVNIINHSEIVELLDKLYIFFKKKGINKTCAIKTLNFIASLQYFIDKPTNKTIDFNLCKKKYINKTTSYYQDIDNIICYGINKNIHPNWKGWDTNTPYKDAVKDTDFFLSAIAFHRMLWNKHISDYIASQNTANIVWQIILENGDEKGIKIIRKILNSTIDTPTLSALEYQQLNQADTKTIKLLSKQLKWINIKQNKTKQKISLDITKLNLTDAEINGWVD